MPISRKNAILAGFTTLALVGAGIAVAQLESADRGILPIDTSQTLEIDGIKVDVGGKSAEEARFAGWRMAQREGFRQLWAKLHASTPDKAPSLTDGALDQLVSSIEIESEQISANRYIATLGILFDRAKAGAILGSGEQVTKSPPFLLIPVLLTGGAATTVELKNPWQRAWAQFRTSQSPVDYVRISGLGPDPLLIQAGQVGRPGRAAWRNALDYYGAVNLLVAEVQLDRAYPGGPAVGRFTAKVGPDGRQVGRFTLRAADSKGIAAMMNEGAVRMDALFADAFASGLVKEDRSLQPPPPPPSLEIVPDETIAKPRDITATPTLNNIQVIVSVPNDAQFRGALAAIRGAGGSPVPQNVDPGGSSVVSVSYAGDASALAAALAAKGWTVDTQGGSIRMSAPGAITR